MDALIYGAVGAALVVVVLVALFRPAWLKYALVGFGLLAGAGIVSVLRNRQRRFRELGVAEDTAVALARLTIRAEQLRTQADAVEKEADRDKELKKVQKELEAALKTAQKEGADKDEVLAEIRRAFPGF